MGHPRSGIHPQQGENAVIDGRLLQAPEQSSGLSAVHQPRGQRAGHVFHRDLHRVEVVERGEVEAVGLALGDGAGHAQALAPQPQMAIAEAAAAQRRILAVISAFHEVVAETGRFAGLGFIAPVARTFSLRCILLFAVIPSGGTCGLFCGFPAFLHGRGGAMFICVIFSG